ncbi:NUDIX hydrolase domain-like protein [Schizophyllum amplum]|uniref:NAD(+) diphosphatase n=1 Tax=Schizophyllum amplum TaxID=97359 RepID=A0A550CVF5_9AGAR|nr:NUDIX hydrolase domain-like protein [Auriculariopsis ampla]
MAETHINLFGGSPLNRLSWLRPSQIFLNAASSFPPRDGCSSNRATLVSAPRDAPSDIRLAYLSTSDVEPFIGNRPWFAQSQDGSALIPAADANHHTEGARHLGPPLVFLGLEETDAQSGNALPSTDFTDPSTALAKLHGTPYFALDVGDLTLPLEQLTAAADTDRKLSWAEPRALIAGMDLFEAGVYAEARSMVDWNARNKFCPGCGSPTYSMWGGWKIACTSLLPWANNEGKKPCPTTRGLHNFTHPRTDPVVIMIAIDETGDKILLGRNKKFPGKFYSALAGFMEPGESFEDAVAREMWEEAGVKVWSVKYHSSQPWPYPANLMVGCYARADSTQPLRIDLDNELEDAGWYTRAEILAILNHADGTNFSGRDNKKLNEAIEGKSSHDTRDKTTHDTPQSGAGALAHSDPNIERKEGAATEPKLQAAAGAKEQAAEPKLQQAATESKLQQAATESKLQQANAKAPESPEPPFRIPPPTAIAGVLIKDWAEGKISFPRISERGGASAL